MSVHALVAVQMWRLVFGLWRCPERSCLSRSGCVRECGLSVVGDRSSLFTGPVGARDTRSLCLLSFFSNPSFSLGPVELTRSCSADRRREGRRRRKTFHVRGRVCGESACVGTSRITGSHVNLDLYRHLWKATCTRAGCVQRKKEDAKGREKRPRRLFACCFVCRLGPNLRSGEQANGKTEQRRLSDVLSLVPVEALSGGCI